MNSKYERANSWSNIVIGAAIEVHRHKGPGLLESIYEKCLYRELQLREVPAVGQMQVEIVYKGFAFFEPLKLDIYVDECLVVELKAVETILPIHKAQLFSYMKLLAAPIGLLVNFHAMTLKEGIHRMFLPEPILDPVRYLRCFLFEFSRFLLWIGDGSKHGDRMGWISQ